MAHAYNSADFCFSNSSGALFKGHQQGEKNKQNHKFGFRAPPICQFMYCTKVLFLFPVALRIVSDAADHANNTIRQGVSF